MATRVIGIPDQDGILRVICGGELLEIQLSSHAKLEPLVAGYTPTPFRWKPWDPSCSPHAILEQAARSFVYLPDLEPLSLVPVPYTNEGVVDLDQLRNTVTVQFADPTLPDPRAVLLRVGAANVHDVSLLGAQVAKAVPNLPIAFDFVSKSEL